MSHVELNIDSETQDFVNNKALLMAQLRHVGMDVEPFYPKGQRMSSAEMTQTLGGGNQFTIRDRKNIVNVTGLAQLMEGLSTSDEGAIVQNYYPEASVAATSVVPGAKGYTMIDGLDGPRHKGGVFGYTGKPEFREATVKVAHEVAKECELHIATVYTIMKKGKPYIVDVQEWREEIPEFAIPYVVATVKAMGEAGVQAVGESVIELAAATVIEIG
jgi:hypothetical protein